MDALFVVWVVGGLYFLSMVLRLVRTNMNHFANKWWEESVAVVVERTPREISNTAEPNQQVVATTTQAPQQQTQQPQMFRAETTNTPNNLGAPQPPQSQQPQPQQPGDDATVAAVVTSRRNSPQEVVIMPQQQPPELRRIPSAELMVVGSEEMAVIMSSSSSSTIARPPRLSAILSGDSIVVVVPTTASSSFTYDGASSSSSSSAAGESRRETRNSNIVVSSERRPSSSSSSTNITNTNTTTTQPVWPHQPAAIPQVATAAEVDDIEAGGVAARVDPLDFIKTADIGSVLSGSISWSEACTCYQYGRFVGVFASLLRLFLWHWMQPLLFYWSWYLSDGEMSSMVLRLAQAVAVRQSIHVVTSTLCAVSKPAFLLVDLVATQRAATCPSDLLLSLGMYLLCPEIFVLLCIFYGRHACVQTFGVLTTFLCGILNLCGLAALVIGLQGGGGAGDGGFGDALLPVSMSLSLAITALSGVASVGFIMVAGVLECVRAYRNWEVDVELQEGRWVVT